MTRAGSKILDEGYVQAVPSGTVNGSNTAFTLSFTPDDTASVQLYVDGLRQTPTTDYTISGTTITMTYAPVVGQFLNVQYNKKV